MTARSVLIVEDQAHVARMLRMRLEQDGFDVEVAQNGELALARMKERDFDAVVTDFQMPKMNGRELCEQIRSAPEQSDTVVFLVTSRVDDELRAWAENHSGIAFFRKPVSLRLLSSELDRQIDAQKSQPAA